MTSLRETAARLDAATPPTRDRTVDALRAFAILGVILGHWLVTAFVAYGDDQLRVTSPLIYLPGFAPASWVFQTLAVFFFVGGYSGAKSLASARRSGQSYGRWAGRRMTRLFRPVPILLLAWVPLGWALSVAGFSEKTLVALVKLVVTPLWFLIVYALLTVLTPVAVALWRLLGPYGAAVPFAVVALVDISRFALDGPSDLGWVNVVAGWLVPFCLGVAWANGGLDSRRVAAGLLVGGAAATAAFVVFAHYPVSMVGVPGAAISNLNPPTLAAAAFATAQVGLALLLRDALGRWMRRPVAWMIIAMANLSAMTLFLWHQTAMMTVTVLGLMFGRLPGLHTLPDHIGWIPARLMWLPVFAAMLAVFWALFRRFEHPRRRPVAAEPAPDQTETAKTAT